MSNLSWAAGWTAQIFAALVLSLRIGAAEMAETIDRFKLLTATSGEAAEIHARMAARAKDMVDAMSAKSPMENMERLAAAMERNATAAKAFGAAIPSEEMTDLADKADAATGKVSGLLEKIESLRLGSARNSLASLGMKRRRKRCAAPALTPA
ncbi:MAG: hypothetical protein NTW96_24520 [Planctomycetia bacterium]|nr:hypothetical protein [Planctomycetia bacterium]